MCVSSSDEPVQRKVSGGRFAPRSLLPRPVVQHVIELLREGLEEGDVALLEPSELRALVVLCEGHRHLVALNGVLNVALHPDAEPARVQNERTGGLVPLVLRRVKEAGCFVTLEMAAIP